MTCTQLRKGDVIMTNTLKRISLLVLALIMGIGLMAAATMPVNAATKKPTKIYLKVSSTSVYVGKTVKVSVKSVKPKKASKSVSYKSSNKSIATVSSKGVVTGKKEGKVKITATSKKNKKVKKSVTITVKEKPVPSVSEKTVYVSPEWVNSVIKGKQPESKNYIILETGTTADAYNKAHIPGAVHCDVHLFETSTYAAYANNTIDFTDESLGNVRSAEELAKVLKEYGITKDTVVITYGAHPATEREAFILLYCGVKNVKVLSGTIDNWTKKYSAEKKVNEPVAGGDDYSFGTDSFPVHPEYILTKQEVKDNLTSNKNFKLVSVRSYDEFCGISDGNYPMLQDKGEIAGAVFGHAGSDANTMEEYLNSDGTVISHSKFNSFMAESNVSSSNEVCFFCGTGWRATMPLLLAYEQGWDVTLYDGGWWAWTRNKGADYDDWIQSLTPNQAKTCSRFNYPDNTVITLKEGESKTKTEMDELAPISIFPASGTLPTVRFKSHDTNVVTVGSDGSLKAIGEGSTTVDMIATDMSGRKTTYTVKVEKSAEAQAEEQNEEAVEE